MSKSVKVLRNSLIALALTTGTPLWAASAPGTGFNVPAHDASRPPVAHMLDLKAPDIRDVLPADQWSTALPNPDDAILAEPETVQVHGAVQAPYVPSGFAALYWAAYHPSEAWRILAPVQ